MMTYTIKRRTTLPLIALVLTICLFIQSCSEPADKFFGIAILNTNTINDFGTPTLAKHISDETLEFPDIPSSKKKGNEAVTSVNNNVMFMEKSLKDIKALSSGDGSRKEIKEKAIALYEYVIPVYKNEYTAYAELCDKKAPQEQKDEILNAIDQKYSAEFESRYAELLAKGKSFAEQNNIPVDWK